MLTVRAKMPDKSTLYTVTSATTRTIYALLKIARIFQPYFKSEMHRARLCPKPSQSPETFCSGRLCCHKGLQKLRTVPKICRLDHLFISYSTRNIIFQKLPLFLHSV
jgi:hypothetical protein